MTDLVVVSLESWDGVWRRNQHLVAGLLRTDRSLRVLFVEPPTDPLHAARTRQPPRRGRGLVAIDDVAGIGAGRLWAWQGTKWLPRRVDPGADGRRAAGVRRAVDRLGWAAPIVWVNDPAGARLLELTGWPALYDITDDWLSAPRSSRELARLTTQEDSLVSRCAQVVVCSPGLGVRKGERRSVTLVPNGVDLAGYLVDPARPQDLPAGPVALYAGTVHPDRMDLDLTVRTAQALQGIGRLVLVGPLPLTTGELDRLSAAGVVLLGPRPAERIAAYLRHADVLVVPHVVTAFTDSLDPIKRYEYQAAGRPVVSTPVAGFLDAGLPRVTVASAADFPAAVATALGAARPGLLPPVDTTVPTWERRVGEMRVVLDRVASGMAS